jgi:hypothetical protein
MKFDIGPGVECDLDRLLETRLLIQANSGGGKSWLLRRILEQTFGHVQQFIIDTEGEFATMRTSFDYVLVAHDGGDTVADPRIAKLTTQRLLELGASAVLDISELKPRQRIEFVRRVAETLVDAPRKLWHPLLFVVDEAQIFCPQKGDAESMPAINDLMGRARKRGFCPVLATLRLSMLHKDSAMLCQNKMVGQSMEIDAKRAADELGLFGHRWRELQALEPGMFYAFGPAISRQVIQVQVTPPVTRPPERGRQSAPPPPPTERIKKLLPQLGDLPTEAETERRTVETLTRDLAQARREAMLARRTATPADGALIEQRIAAAVAVALKEPERRGASLEKTIGASADLLSDVISSFAELQGAIMDIGMPSQSLQELRRLIDEQIADAVAKEREKRTRLERAILAASRAIEKTSRQLTAATNGAQPVGVPPPGVRPAAPVRHEAPPASREPPARTATNFDTGANDLSGIRAGAVRILRELARRHPLHWTKAQVAQLTGFTASGGTFTTYLGDLRRAGFIELAGKEVYATEAGLAAVGEVPAAPMTHDEVMEMWREKMRAGEYRLLEAIAAAGEIGIDKQALAAEVEMTMTGGTFNTYIGTLRRNGLIEVRAGFLLPSALLWPEEVE